MASKKTIEVVKDALEQSTPRKFLESIELAINIKEVDLSIPKNRIDEEVLLPGAENAEQITFKEVLDIGKCRPVTGVIGGGKYWNFKEGIKPFMFSSE